MELLTNAMHWAYGTSWGAWYGHVAGSRHPANRPLTFGTNPSLDRGGHRQINTAIHRVAITRARCHPETKLWPQQTCQR